MLEQNWHAQCFYRVSIKAVIRNEQGRVLVVREKNNPKWNLPGGGMDYGESEYEALRRELHEEVGYEGHFRYIPLGIEPIFVEDKNAWLLWVVYEVLPDNFNFTAGAEANEISFKDVTEFKESRPLIYKFSNRTHNTDSATHNKHPG